MTVKLPNKLAAALSQPSSRLATAPRPSAPPVVGHRPQRPTGIVPDGAGPRAPRAGHHGSPSRWRISHRARRFVPTGLSKIPITRMSGCPSPWTS